MLMYTNVSVSVNIISLTCMMIMVSAMVVSIAMMLSLIASTMILRVKIALKDVLAHKGMHWIFATFATTAFALAAAVETPSVGAAIKRWVIFSACRCFKISMIDPFGFIIDDDRYDLLTILFYDRLPISIIVDYKTDRLMIIAMVMDMIYHRIHLVL
jgi:hypothetical protein